MSTRKRTRPKSSRHRKKSEAENVVEANIDSLVEMRRAEERKRGKQEQLAGKLTQFSGSMAFVYVHALWFGGWILFNMGWLGSKPFDPYPFSLLTLIVSLEAIFLSTFVLISQNRDSVIADKRADLDLQINLLSEHEITRLLVILEAVSQHLGIDLTHMVEIEDLKKDVPAEEVLNKLESRQEDKK